MKAPKFPCRSCVYFAECGDDMRTEQCTGRLSKRQQKALLDAGYVPVILHSEPISLNDIGVNEFFCAGKEAVAENIYLRCGTGNGTEVPYFDNIGTPCFSTQVERKVYPVDRDIALKLWSNK